MQVQQLTRYVCNCTLKLGGLLWCCSCLPEGCCVILDRLHGEVATHGAAYLSRFGDSDPWCSGEESWSLSSRLCPR